MSHQIRERVKLTAQEQQILRMLAEGNSTKQIATRLGVSLKTADYHRQKIMGKTKARDVAALTRYAIANGIFVVPSELVRVGGNGDHMTGLFVQVTRDGRPRSVEIEYLTDEEFDALEKQSKDAGDCWKWVRALARWIRENVHPAPAPAPKQKAKK